MAPFIMDPKGECGHDPRSKRCQNLPCPNVKITTLWRSFTSFPLWSQLQTLLRIDIDSFVAVPFLPTRTLLSFSYTRRTVTTNWGSIDTRSQKVPFTLKKLIRPFSHATLQQRWRRHHTQRSTSMSRSHVLPIWNSPDSLELTCKHYLLPTL